MIQVTATIAIATASRSRIHGPSGACQKVPPSASQKDRQAGHWARVLSHDPSSFRESAKSKRDMTHLNGAPTLRSASEIAAPYTARMKTAVFTYLEALTTSAVITPATARPPPIGRAYCMNPLFRSSIRLSTFASAAFSASSGVAPRS